MKTYWSAFFLSLLMLLTGCGQEHFGTPSQNEHKSVNALQVLEQASCSNRTLVNPPVDILYVVDNSMSTWLMPDHVKQSIQGTINTISNQFDTRIIGTPLLKTSKGDSDFQIWAKNPATIPSSFLSHKVNSSSEFTFFTQEKEEGASEPGLARIRDFITAHQSDKLFRQDAYLFIILVSNGRDTDIEKYKYANGETTYYPDIYSQRLTELKLLKEYLSSIQFRLFSVTASGSSCPSGYFNSAKSYVQMSKDLYDAYTNPALTDQTSSNPDHYNLCSSSDIRNVFSSVNSTIEQVVIPHKYKYWPITFTNTAFDTSKIQVRKYGPNSSGSAMTRGTQWDYQVNASGTINTRIEPTPGEPTSAPHLIKFQDGHEIVYPDCVSITSTTNKEFFKYVVLSRKPVWSEASINITINGRKIPFSSLTYVGHRFESNTKVAHNGYPDTPEQKATGYFIELKNSSDYYESGDNVEVRFIPDAI